ncbi:MAG: hypothetical protein ABIC91_00680 [Nanoarchaeota archaeon]|nr:hypothetical protein [Nanoarchaeota archaeon]MBU1029886.1 hypothetical protein [Nanoarchaeota archaeon]MBU1850682.1 hypothetical protein [Nanoarchaeota archaeon]
MNKKLSLVLILILVGIGIVPVVSAATNAWYTIGNVMDDVVNFIVTEDVYETAKLTYSEKAWIPITILFFLCMGIIHATLSFTPRLKDLFATKGLKLAVSLPLSFFAIQSSMAVGIIGGVGPTFIGIILVIVFILLFSTILKSFSAGHSEASTMAFGAQKEKLKAQRELTEIKQDDNISEKLLDKENSAIKGLDKLEKALEINVTRDLRTKLVDVLSFLQQVEKMGPRDSDQLKNYSQRGLNVLKSILPTVKNDCRVVRELNDLTDSIKRIDLSVWKEEKSVTNLENRLKSLIRARTSAAAVTPQQTAAAQAMTKRIMSISKTKEHLEEELLKIESIVKRQLSSFNRLIEDAVNSLEHGNINDAIAKIQEGLNIENKETNELQAMRKLISEVNNLNRFEILNLRSEHMVVDRMLNP